MKILHLFSNWKWTGPADPTLNLCKGLEKRGHDVTFAYRKPPLPVEDSIEKRVLQAGVKSHGSISTGPFGEGLSSLLSTDQSA